MNDGAVFVLEAEGVLSAVFDISIELRRTKIGGE